MRFVLAALVLAIAPAAAAQSTDARALFVERRGMMEVERRCNLLSDGAQTALQAGAAQARGALLRSGWTGARVRELETTTVNAARQRACDDPRTASAVRAAQAGYATWARVSALTFQGNERNWIARRLPDANGWRLAQNASAPIATLGVREGVDARQRFTLRAPAFGGVLPSSAQLLMRDASRFDTTALDMRSRRVSSLAVNAPPASAARRFFAATRVREGSGVAFVFPDDVFQAMLRLDPRESVVIELAVGNRTERLYFEVGDVAAARAFLTLEIGA